MNAVRRTLQVEEVSLDEISFDPDNVRVHSDEQIGLIAQSLDKFGQQKPIVIDEDGIVAAGNGTAMAAMRLGWTMISAIRTNLSGEELRAYKIADNRTGDLSSWDTDKLLEQLQGFSDESLRDATGYDEKDLLALIEREAAGADAQADEAPELDEQGNPVDHDKYTNTIKTPIYTPKGEKPPISALIDRTKTDELLAEIKRSTLPKDVKRFLSDAAERHTKFNFRQIAEFYCHADATLQNLMERSGLVIIDYQKAIENGFVHMSDRLGELVDMERQEAEDSEEGGDNA